MITLEEYGVITRLDFNSSDADSRALYLKNNADLVSISCFVMFKLLWKVVVLARMLRYLHGALYDTCITIIMILVLALWDKRPTIIVIRYMYNVVRGM